MHWCARMDPVLTRLTVFHTLLASPSLLTFVYFEELMCTDRLDCVSTRNNGDKSSPTQCDRDNYIKCQ